MTATSMASTTSTRTTTTDPATAYRAAERALLSDLGVVGKERFIELKDPAMRLRVVEWGEGPPLLHIHGGGAFGALHAPLAAALPGRRHILLDRPGFGLSERAPLLPHIRTHSVAMLHGLLDALGLEQVDVSGNSLGGAMALWLALDERGAKRVKSIGFVGGIAMVGEIPSPFFFRLMATPVVGDLFLALEPPSMKQVRSFYARFGHPPDTLHLAMLDMLLQSELFGHFNLAWKDVIRATNSFRGFLPGVEIMNGELANVRCQVAFAWDRGDPMVPEAVGRNVAGILGAPFTLVGDGHCPWLNDAGGVATAIEPVLTPVREILVI